MEATSKVNKQNAQKYSCTEWWGPTSAPQTPAPARLLSCSMSMETVCPTQTQNQCPFFWPAVNRISHMGELCQQLSCPECSASEHSEWHHIYTSSSDALLLLKAIRTEKIHNLMCMLIYWLCKCSKPADEFQFGFWSSEATALLWITSALFSSEGWRNLNKRAQTWWYDAPWSPMSPLVEPAFTWVRVSGCRSLSVVLAHWQTGFPILPLLCPCFLQFLSNSFLLPYLLIRGTPQRMCIIPVRSCKPFMSWEDMLARMLPVPFSLYDTCNKFNFPDKPSISFYLNPPPPCFDVPYPRFYLSLSPRLRSHKPLQVCV